MATNPSKCANDACACPTEAGKKYCSTHCEDTKNLTKLTCHCGHDSCKTKAI